jgi:hypothetical protein
LVRHFELALAILAFFPFEAEERNDMPIQPALNDLNTTKRRPGATKRPRAVAALLCLIFAVSFEVTAQAQPDFSATHIETGSLVAPENQSLWRQYFRWLNRQNDEQISRDFRRLQDILTSKDESNLGALLKMLHSLRPDLPMQIRWLLSAVEIKQGITDFHTLADAQLALQFTNVQIESKLVIAGEKSELRPDLLYKLPGDTGESARVLRLGSRRHLVFLQRYWQRLPTLIPAEAVTERLEQSRVRWMSAIALMRDEQSTDTVLDLLEEFTPSAMRRFTSSADKDRFLELSTQLLSDLSIHFLGSTAYRDDKPAYESKSPESRRIQGLIKSWIGDDPLFFVQKYSSLRLYRFVNLHDFLARPMDDGNQRQLVNFLSSKKGDAESFLISVMALTKNKTIAPSPEMRAWSKTALQILLSAFMKHDRVVVTTGVLDSASMSPSQFDALMSAFYDAYTSGWPLDPELAHFLIKHRTPRTETMSDDRWNDLEWKRLECAERGLAPEEFKAALIERMASTREGDVYDGLLAGRYLNVKLSNADLDAVAAQFKIRMRGAGDDAANEAWAKNNARMTKVMFALSPKDADLQAYLASIYFSRRVDTAVAPQDALEYLAKSGAAPVEVRDELIRRLRFVGHGDTVGNFLALIRLFPGEGLEIIGIIHRHRSAPEKIKHLLRVLVSESEANPQLYESIKNAVKTHPDKTLYQGQLLHSWIKSKIEMRAGGNAENQCRQLFSLSKR